MFRTVHPDRGARGVPYESVMTGLNYDLGEYPESGYIVCRKCGWKMNKLRHAKGWTVGNTQASSQLNGAIDSTGPVALWKCNDDAASTAVDEHYGNSDGTSAQNTEDISVEDGTALAFNGSTDYITMSSADALKLSTDFTICFWIKRDAAGAAAERVMSKSDKDAAYTNDFDYFLQVTHTTGKFLFGGVDAGNSSFYVDGNTSLGLGVWRHIVCRKKSNVLEVFYNTVNDTGSTTGTVANLRQTTMDLQIGRIGAGGTWYYSFDGSMKDIRFYDTALTQAQITEIYNSGSGTMSGGNRITLDGNSTFATPRTGSITAFATTRLGTVVTAAAHGLKGGTVTITATTNYNGTFHMQDVTTNTFVIARKYVADDATGTWTVPEYAYIHDTGSHDTAGDVATTYTAATNSPRVQEILYTGKSGTTQLTGVTGVTPHDDDMWVRQERKASSGCPMCGTFLYD